MTVVAVHQPNYLPWLGFFAKASASDVLVLLDTVQFEKNSFTNRVRFKGSQGVYWLTQPVRMSHRAYQTVNEVEFADRAWPRKHLKTLQSSYGRAPYFDRYFPDLTELLRNAGPNLAPCNGRLIGWVLSVLGLTTTVLRASDLTIEPTQDPTQRLVRLVRAVGGDTYVSGSGGFNYQDLDVFAQAGIEVRRSPSTFGVYPQLWDGFNDGLSILDLIFNCGPHSRSYLQGELSATGTDLDA
jgi:hypothetical protein